MLKNFIEKLTESAHGKQVHEFQPAPLTNTNKSHLTFIVNEKNGEKKMVLVLQEDEGHEIDREYCEIDVNCLDDLERLVSDAKEYVRMNFRSNF
jgi:hypothetical protein